MTLVSQEFVVNGLPISVAGLLYFTAFYDLQSWLFADFYASQSGKIGPDPLREDANAELVWTKLRNTKKPVGLVLMDQSMVAGIGNIYRAEILFKASLYLVDDPIFWKSSSYNLSLLKQSMPLSVSCMIQFMMPSL